MTNTSIIIPVFNQWKLTEACLNSIKQFTDPSVEVIVVDNGSYDETKSKLPGWVKTITLEKNFGFNYACRVGIKESKNEHIVLLNNDTVVTEFWLEELIRALSLSNVGIVGPKLVTIDGKEIQHGGYVFNHERNVFYPLYQGLEPSNSLVNRMRDLPALLGACLLFRRSDYESIGGMVDYALEDIDLCLKLGEKGLRTLLAPKSVVLHHSSATFRLSNDSEIPKTDRVPFFAYWTKEKLSKLKSDKEIFIQDGIELLSITDNKINTKETAEDVLALWNQPHNENSLRKIIELYSGFLPAIYELDDLSLFLSYLEDFPDDAGTIRYVLDRWSQKISPEKLKSLEHDLNVLTSWGSGRKA